MLQLFDAANPRLTPIYTRLFAAAEAAAAAAAATRSLSRRTPSLHAEQQKAIDTALRVLELVSSEPNNDSRPRLIQSCKLDVALPRPSHTPNPPSLPPSSRETTFLEEDPLALLQELHRRGLPPDSAAALSLLGSAGDMIAGQQLHSLSLKAGTGRSTAVSSSLVSLYSKCGRPVDARKVFDDMPTRDTVLYTSIIAALAQRSQVGPCLQLLNEMRRCGFDPNDFTIASALGACTYVGWIGLGRSIHGLGLRMGFRGCPHVCNALISMYARCGSIGEASCVFERMEGKDLVSCNAMISGFARYGLVGKALGLLEDMVREKKETPDAITFLGVLSSCCHAGLVEQGYQCFQLMINYGVQLGLDHYSCIVDLLGRAGLLEEALNFIKTMPIRPNGVIWGSLLSACKVHGDVRMGILAAQNRLLLEPGCAATHVQLANMYAAVGWWSGVADVRKLMKETGLNTNPGFSWIELGIEIYRFKAEGRTESHVNEGVYLLEILDEHMKDLGLAPESILELEIDAIY